MYKHLFFDDKYLFEKVNTKRCYGEPALIESAVYHDENAVTVWGGPWVFPLADGRFRMLYQGRINIEGYGLALLSAISEDGIHFKPEDLTRMSKNVNRAVPNEVMRFEGEVASIIEDPYHSPTERYKLLYTEVNNDTLMVEGDLYVSEDLLNWEQVDGVTWSNDGEGIAGVFYNCKKKCHTIINRPIWGARMLGYYETEDWRTYTPKTFCMQTDGLDAPLEEMYCMPTFEYDGWVIGFPHIYGGLESSMGAKIQSGTMKAQLAYSYNGSYFLRSLREPFISGELPDSTAREHYEAPMVWPTSISRDGDSVYIYACASLREHGTQSFWELGTHGRIYVYRLRTDGFIRLENENKNQESIVATRENTWHGGELHINLKAKKATVAVYQSDKIQDAPFNILGISEVIPGYTHEECIPFSGDLCDWTPQFYSGKCLNELEGKVIAIEIKYEDGELYSIYGDMTPMFNVEAQRYRQLGKLPTHL